MAIEKVHIDQFLELARHYPVVDVRSPSEYFHAHIPGAHHLPLFSDEERKIVGTTYKQQSREAAIKLALDYFGPKLRMMVEKVEEWVIHHESSSKQTSKQNCMADVPFPVTNDNPKSRCVLVHCWRGGMRSAGVAWLLDLYGFKVYTLIGGYKKFRHFVLEIFQQPYSFNILGGYTGSGKTLVLQQLQRMGHPVIDLEALACHKGSAFGALGEKPQPSQEMFENLLAVALWKKSTPAAQHLPAVLPIWLEDESQRIGAINIPPPLWKTMRRSPVYFLDIPFEKRLDSLTKTYGHFPKAHLVNAILRIQKRLGGLETKTAIYHLLEDNVKECFRILLKYYDKCYSKGLHNREEPQPPIQSIGCQLIEPKQMAEMLHQLSTKTTVPLC